MFNQLAEDLEHILDATREIWEELRGNRILITGGTGFFGLWLLETFAWATHRLQLNTEVHVLARNPSKLKTTAPHLFYNSFLRFHAGDIISCNFPEGAFTHIIHAATSTSATLNSMYPLVMLDTIVKGTRRTLEFATHCQAKRFLMISSGAVYGKQRIRLNHIPEDYECGPDPLNPLSAYAEGKRMAELLCAIYAHEKGIGINIARCFAFIGPYLPLDVHFAIGNFIQDGLNGGPILVRGDGTPYRSYLYASDLVIWLLKLLQRAEGCAAFNVGSEHGLSIAELAQIVAECFYPPVQVNILGCSDSNKISDRYVPSTQKIRSEIKVEETVDLRTAILKTISWHRQMKSM